jgi:hypothetical protein
MALQRFAVRAALSLPLTRLHASSPSGAEHWRRSAFAAGWHHSSAPLSGPAGQTGFADLVYRLALALFLTLLLSGLLSLLSALFLYLLLTGLILLTLFFALLLTGLLTLFLALLICWPFFWPSLPCCWPCWFWFCCLFAHAGFGGFF